MELFPRAPLACSIPLLNDSFLRWYRLIQYVIFLRNANLRFYFYNEQTYNSQDFPDNQTLDEETILISLKFSGILISFNTWRKNENLRESQESFVRRRHRSVDI